MTDTPGIGMYRTAMRVPPDAIREYCESLGVGIPDGLEPGQAASPSVQRQVAHDVVAHFADDDAAELAAQAFDAEQ